MTGMYSFLADVTFWLKLIDDQEKLEESEFYLWRHEYEDLGGDYGTDIGNRIYDISPIVFDEKIIVVGHLKFLPYLDYLSVGTGDGIMNQKMLDALLSIRDFPHEKLPCRIMDIESLDHGLEFRQYADDALAANYPHNDDYFFLHLTSHTSLPQGLQTDPADLPPILKPDPKDKLFGTYVTQQGKDALIAAQVHGVDFTVPYQYQEPLQN
jgi:hypothetical protein